MSPSNLEGMTLGKYRILEPLGRGGMAQVYKAYHPQLDRYVAIKILRSDLVESNEFLARFRSEAHAVSGLRHANIVQVFDFDMQDDYYYMVMELLEGDTLRTLLNNYRVRNQRMPLTEIVQILKDILIPASVPALATQATFTFLYAWNSFIWPLVIINVGNEKNLVLTLALNVLRGRASDTPNLILAGAAIAILPPLIVFILGQRFFVESVASSGVKGLM